LREGFGKFGDDLDKLAEYFGNRTPAGIKTMMTKLKLEVKAESSGESNESERSESDKRESVAEDDSEEESQSKEVKSEHLAGSWDELATEVLMKAVKDELDKSESLSKEAWERIAKMCNRTVGACQAKYRRRI
jgi:hypothetical protein